MNKVEFFRTLTSYEKGLKNKKVEHHEQRLRSNTIAHFKTENVSAL